MQVSVETTTNIERVMTVHVPAERIESEVQTRLESLKKRVRLNGFRPGKVPLKVVKQQYGSSVYQEVLGEVLQTSYEEAIQQESLKPAGAPSIEPVKMAPGEELEYKATFEVYPEVALVDLSDAEIEKIEAEIKAEDVDKMVENLREQRQSWEPVDREARDGDQIVVDFEGFLGDEAFDGGKAEDMPIVLGKGQMIPGFEEALKGLKAGDETSFEVNFPEDYHSEKLAGKPARFDVKVKAVNEGKLPEIDEEFCKQFGIEEGSVEKLRADVEANMQRELTQAIKTRLKNQAMDLLVEKHEVEIPKSLLADEIGRLKQQAAQASGQQPDLPDEMFADEATRRVKLGLIVGQIIKDKDISLDSQRVDATLEDLASSYEVPEQVKQYYRNNPDQMSMIEAMVLEEQVVDWVVEQAKVTVETKSFDELMNR